MAVVMFAISMTLFTFLIGSLRWWILLRYSVKHVSFTNILPSYYLGVFFNNILPTTMGGDVVRTIHLGLHGISMKSLIGSTFIDRGIGFFVILSMGILSLSLSQEIKLGTRYSILLAVAASTMLLGLWLLFSENVHKRIGRLTVKYQRNRIRRFLWETLHLCHSYNAAWREIIAAMALTIVMQSAVIISYYALGETIGIFLSPLTYFGIIPIVFLAGAVPISLGGIGVRESVLVGLLVMLGVNTQQAITLSLLYLFVLLVSSLPGALVMLLSRPGKIIPS